MKSYVRYIAALALVSAAPLAAQTGRTGADSAHHGPGHARAEHHRGERAPFQRLIAARQELQLTDAQVTRLQEIGRRLEERNAPLRAQLTAQRQQYAAQRRAQVERLSPEARRDTLTRLRQQGRRREVPEAMRVPMNQMRENTRAAMQEAQSVLTPQQKDRARQLMEQHRREHGSRRGEGRRGRRGEPRTQGGTGTIRS